MDRTGVVVVGAGLAGLAAGAAAAGQGAGVVVVDAQRPGGRARTTQRGAVAWNQGPHALYLGGEASRVLAALGVRPTGGAPFVAGGRLETGGRLHVLPGGAATLARSTALRPRSRVQLGRLLAGLGRIAPAAVAGRSTNAWFDALGLHDDARGVVAALVRVATYTADHDLLPAEVALAQLRLARRGVLYLDDGFGQLVAGVRGAAERAGATVLDHDPVVEVAATPGGWMVATASGRRWVAPAVVLAAGGALACAALLPAGPGRPGAWAAAGPDARVACLGVVTRRRPDPPLVFGVDEPLYLSTHCPPARLAPDGLVVVEVMRYRTTAETGDRHGDRAQLEGLLGRAGVAPDDVVDARYLHDMPAVRGVPDPAVGLAGRPPVAVGGADGLFVAGDWAGPAGWLADASLASGEAAGLLAAAAWSSGATPVAPPDRTLAR